MASGGRPLCVAVLNQAAGGGATAAARSVLDWGPGRGLEISYHPAGPAEDASALLAALEAFAPDVLHAHCWYNAWPYATLADLSRRWPTLLSVHDVAPVNQFGTECWECYRNPWCLGCPALGPLRRWRPNHRIAERVRRRRANRRLAATLVLPSEWMRRRLARSELRRLPAETIPYGIDTAYFGSGVPSPASFGLPEGPVVLFAGNMYSPADHRKGLPDLLHAFAPVRRAVPGVTLAIAGRLEGSIATDGVRVLGEIPSPRLPDLYASASVFCLPSRGDNLPLTGLEAMAAGLPVVGTRVGGIPEEIDHGVTGLLVPPSDPSALAAALIGLLQDRPRAVRFGAAGRERARARFDRALEAGRHEALYRRLQSAPAGT